MFRHLNIFSFLPLHTLKFIVICLLCISSHLTLTSFSYLQPNGYKPAPLELSGMHLSGRLEELVDALAENTHNVWARDRIQQGWTYGATEVNCRIDFESKNILMIFDV